MQGMLEIRTGSNRGCLSYRLYEEPRRREKYLLVLVKEWGTQEDLESHIRTDNQRWLLALMDRP